MNLDLDRYYTPEGVARWIMEKSELSDSPKVCVDSTCGMGNLLYAASTVFGNPVCVGIDRDRGAITKLQKKHPDWILTVGNLLSNRKNVKWAATVPNDSDLLVLNPPFSQGNKKYVDINFRGIDIKASVAMAHLLRSFEVFRPSQGAIVIAPESLLYSEIDADARALVSQSHIIKKIADLESSTFLGARAHATVVQFVPGIQISRRRTLNNIETDVRVHITRGGLPVHVMVPATKGGLPFIHSSDLRSVVQENAIRNSVFTITELKGRIDGWVMLLPRVGVPHKQSISVVNLGPVQLSDCVIALEFKTKHEGKEVEKRILNSWDSFLGMYRGTGARYITLSRLKSWLADRNILCDK